MKTLLIFAVLGLLPLLADDAQNFAEAKKHAMHLSGQVVSKDSKGYVVTVAASSEASTPAPADKKKRPAPKKGAKPALPSVPAGTIFLESAKPLAIGAIVEQDVYPTGSTTSLDSTSGRLATLDKYRVLSDAAPARAPGKPADKSKPKLKPDEKPFDPGSMQHPI